jgi:hypothetical protein
MDSLDVKIGSVIEEYDPDDKEKTCIRSYTVTEIDPDFTEDLLFEGKAAVCKHINREDDYVVFESTYDSETKELRPVFYSNTVTNPMCPSDHNFRLMSS